VGTYTLSEWDKPDFQAAEESLCDKGKVKEEVGCPLSRKGFTLAFGFQ
jgi:hypothetical protein